jgi:pimeloyl-ACP methyl ester carboxylesterase
MPETPEISEQPMEGIVVDRLPIRGPYREVDVAGGGKAPFYVIPFDEDGVCTGPVTRQHLLEALGQGSYTDVFLFSHGWNNTWPSAITRYEGFISGFAGTRAQYPLAGQAFRPLLVGVFWPSAVLVQPEERAPDIAGAGVEEANDTTVAEERRGITEVARVLPSDRRARFYELAQRQELEEGEARELAALLAPLWSEDRATDDLGSSESLPPEELLDIWGQLAETTSPNDDFGFASFGFEGPPVGPSATLPAGPAAAGWFDKLRRLDPLDLVRGTTVWLMKDRAGRVGARGVQQLLADMLAAAQAHVHLVGHSYGGKVVLSALCAGDVPRPVESVLLLQPAMSHLCFSPQIAGLDRPGGYRAALDPQRCRQPILTTFSSHDEPLTREFHLFVRRRSDLAEAVIAGEAPSRYAALGGYGPLLVGGESTAVAANDPGAPYAPDGGVRVLGIESSRVISGHSDVSNAWTWWMLLDQVDREG